MSWSIKSYEDNDELVDEMAPKIIAALLASIEKKGDASLVVSGGSTPRSLFNHLSKSDLPWSKVTVTLVDERWVDEAHQDSNARLVKEHLLQNNAKAATFISLTDLDAPSDEKKNNASKSKNSSAPFLSEKIIE